MHPRTSVITVEHMDRITTTNDTNTDALTVPADVTTLYTVGTDNGSTVYWQWLDQVSDGAILYPVMTDAANETGWMAIYGVRKAFNVAGTNRWTHLPMLFLDLTAGSLATGNTDEFYADTIVVSSNATGYSDLELVHNVSARGDGDFANSPAYITIPRMGCDGILVGFRRNSCASINTLISGTTL